MNSQSNCHVSPGKSKCALARKHKLMLFLVALPLLIAKLSIADLLASVTLNRELKIDDAATPRRGVNIYDKKNVFWNLMSVTTI